MCKVKSAAPIKGWHVNAILSFIYSCPISQLNQKWGHVSRKQFNHKLFTFWQQLDVINFLTMRYIISHKDSKYSKEFPTGNHFSTEAPDYSHLHLYRVRITRMPSTVFVAFHPKNRFDVDTLDKHLTGTAEGVRVHRDILPHLSHMLIIKHKIHGSPRSNTQTSVCDFPQKQHHRPPSPDYIRDTKVPVIRDRHVQRTVLLLHKMTTACSKNFLPPHTHK